MMNEAKQAVLVTVNDLRELLSNVGYTLLILEQSLSLTSLKKCFTYPAQDSRRQGEKSNFISQHSPKCMETVDFFPRHSLLSFSLGFFHKQGYG